MLHDPTRWEAMVSTMYDIEPKNVPLELRVKYVSIPILANASRAREQMFRQPHTLTDEEWQLDIINSIGCSIELLGIIGVINFLPHARNGAAVTLYNRLQNLRQILPDRECHLQPEERQMTFFIANSMREGALIYLLCRGMRFVHYGLKAVGCY